ncbi:hypothetical protein SDRG_03270 [Saprolegnia diclina VS20]|uniref:Uncharacterized protein n=1 Tax=Saprolegnia diclina (strain VS20) TaxID=1156394 RepID=T0S8U6_SAPDV|nr:hypothetical protein SDRG_03270 [Saprolegnia diclina VS20]EQC39062.1 hypothetical protein SDRG_03270 [Saprolegnia diclina VS20]|eukprot:XP_008607123.1 hypothetical protein SDRG_03270 [Saprolegnia diclina VS20]
MLYNSQYIQDKEAKRRAREEQLFRETYPALYATEQRRKAKKARVAVPSSKPQPKKTAVVRPTTTTTKPAVAARKKTPAATPAATISPAAHRTIDEQHATIARLQQAAQPETRTTLDTISIPTAPVPTPVADSAAIQGDTNAQSSETKSSMAILQQAILHQAPTLHRVLRTSNFLHAPPLLWTPDERVAAIDTLVRAITAIEMGQPMAPEPYLVLVPCPSGRRDVALEFEETLLRGLMARARKLSLL